MVSQQHHFTMAHVVQSATLFYVLLHLVDTLFCWNIMHTIVCHMYSFARLDLPENKQDPTRAWIRLACLVWSQERGVSYNQDQRGKVRARQADAGTGDSSNGRERKGPGGRSGDSQSRLTTLAVNREEQKAEWDSSPDIWKWHKDVRSGNMLLAGILLVGFLGQCLFFSYLTLANGTITFSHYLSPKCITIFTRRQSGILRTHDIREWMWVRPSFPANNIL